MADLTKRQRELLDLLLRGVPAPDISGNYRVGHQRFSERTGKALFVRGLAVYDDERNSLVATDKARRQACK